MTQIPAANAVSSFGGVVARAINISTAPANSIAAQITELEGDLSDDIVRITGAWDEKAAAIDSVPVSLERTDVQVAQLVLAWVPVA